MTSNYLSEIQNEKIKNHLQNQAFLANLANEPITERIIKKIEDYAATINDSNPETVNSCVTFLLKTATELSMLDELHELLELNLLENINQPLQLEGNDNGKTLLGIAAFH